MNLPCVTQGSWVRLIQGEMERNSECCDADSSQALGTAGQPQLAGTNFLLGIFLQEISVLHSSSSDHP